MMEDTHNPEVINPPEENKSATKREAHVGMKHSGVALQEGDQGGGEGGQLLLVALCHLWHTHIVS